MKTATCPSFTITLHLAGPIEVAKQWLRGECLREGLCVTIEPELFIYTGGEEAGYRVGLLNYPRFPSEPKSLLTKRAEEILLGLIEATHQHSGLLVSPTETKWFTRREAA
jgi:hypothetical protein